jgi:membrane protease YdiL (CAAX protease family)
MRHTLRFATFLIIGICVACLITPAAIAVLEGTRLEISPYRIWGRLALAALMIAAILAAPRRASLRDDELPFGPGSGRVRETVLGFVAGLTASLLLVCWLVFQGHMHFTTEFNWADDGLDLLLIVPISATVVAVLEEWIFRQLLFVPLRRDRGPMYAALATSFAFGAVHFFHVSRSTPPPELSSFTGFSILGTMLQNTLNVENQRVFVGLLTMGLVFALARLLTGRLFLAIGLHASLVFFNRMDGTFTSWNTEEHTIWTGGRHYNAGIPGWVAMLTMAGVLIFLIRRRERQASLPAPVPIPIPSHE